MRESSSGRVIYLNDCQLLTMNIQSPPEVEHDFTAQTVYLTQPTAALGAIHPSLTRPLAASC